MLLLHTLVPHSHLGETSSSDQKRTFSEAENILDFIQIMFLTDLGDGHMEHFESGDGLSDLSLKILESPSFDIFFSEQIISVKTELLECQEPIYPPDLIFLKVPSLYSFDLRGPPTFLS